MTPRILKPGEWIQPEGVDVPPVLRYVAPHNVATVVIEDGERAVAGVSVIQMSHFESLWIRPEYRGNAGAFRALIRQAYALPLMRGEQWLLAGVRENDDKMKSICSRLGGQALPSRFYLMPVGI